MRTLHLLRHAKSDWSDSSLPDHDRPLNKRGRRARNSVAELVDGWKVDVVVCSTARRARDTARPVVKTLGCPVRYEDAVYGASAPELLHVIRALPDESTSVMLVGHNPGMEELTDLLCGTTPAYPTAALGTIDLDVDRWADVDRGTGELTAFNTVR